MTEKIKLDPAGSDWHLSGFPILDAQGQPWHLNETEKYVIATKPEHIPQQVHDYIQHEEIPVTDKAYLNIIAQGRDWLISPFEAHQPKTHAVLAEHASDFKLWFYFWEGGQLDGELSMQGYFEVLGRMIHVDPDSFRGVESNPNASLSRALPPAIAHSWYWRADGWDIGDEASPSPMVSRQLPDGNWWPIGEVLDTFKRGTYKKHKEVILAQIPDLVYEQYIEQMQRVFSEVQLRCMLDTRPYGIGGPYGDQLFILTHSESQVVYHIHDGDFHHIRQLHQPEEAIDAYCAHTLLRIPGRFDFMPWSEPLK